MSSPSGITEVAILPLKAGTSLNPNEHTGTIFQEALATLTSQPQLQRVYFGTEVENPNVLRLFVDWDSVDSHKQFQDSPQYQPFLKTLGSLLDGKPLLYHVPLTPHPPSAALGVNSPATEVLTVHFAASVSESTMSAFEARAKQLAASIEENAGPAVFRASAGGWAVESDIPREGSEEKGKVYVALLGWESVASHHSFRETKEFKDNIHLLREAEGITATTMVHVTATQIDAGGIGAEERGVGDPGAGGGIAQEEILNPQRGEKVAPKTKSDGTTTKTSQQSQYS